MTIRNIQYELKESRENIILALELKNSIQSIDEITDDKKDSIFNILKINGHEDDTIKKIILKEELEKLNKQERLIIISRFFYDKTQVEIAKKLSISQVQVSRLEKKILTQMRINIKERL